MSKADYVISASNYTKGIIESNYGLSGNHIITVYSAVSMPESLSEVKAQKEIFKVLFAGRIDGNKGIEYFIEIARKVLKKNKDVRFVVAGRGLGNVKLEEIKGFKDIASKFTYLGFLKRDKLFELFVSCDVLCMPSISEPFGLTAIEAASVGLPVILSNKTGASEVLNRTPMADFWDTDRFADHILSIKENSKLREKIIENNRNDISKLSWESSADQVFQLYNKLLGN
jgi:glycosyltransferase involved in cell wall biosynthesis